jgi:hypothetical protein
MKLKELFLNLIVEQQDDDDFGVHGFDDGEFAGGGPEMPEDPNDPDPESQFNPETGDTQTQISKPKKEKPLSEIQKLKLRWKEENPGLTEDSMNNSINFFNRRKNGMIEYKHPGYINPLTGRRHVNLPEIAALANRFPEMQNVLSDHAKIRDIQNYTWEQMEFFMDRVNTQQTNVELEVKIEGDTPELQKASAYKIWENARNKIVNERNLVVIKVESKPESIALGYLQHILNNEETEREKRRSGSSHVHMNNNWCITYGVGEGNNMYYDYRNRRSYYFVLDKNRPEHDLYYLSVLQPIKTGHREYPYVVTLRNNMGERHNLEWHEVVDTWPALEGKQNLFKYFDLTYKEVNDISIDKINFKENTRNNPNPYDFAIQNITMQRRYIESNRYINNTRAFDVLPHDEKKLYIAMTKLEGSDYKKRYRCDDPNDPLGMLNLIQDTPGGLYKFLDGVILKDRLGIVSGVHGLKVGIVGIELKILYSTVDEKYTLYQQRNNNLIGIMNMETLDMVKPMQYIHSKTQMVFDNQINRPYLMYRYVDQHGNDYFYFILPLENLTGDKKSAQYMKGFYYNKDAGNNLLNSGRIRIIKGY